MKKAIFLVVFMSLFLVVTYSAFNNMKDDNPYFTVPGEEVTYEEPDAPSSNGSPYKYYYNQLSVIEKNAYNSILDNIYDMPESISIPEIDKTELDNIFEALVYDNPDLFFVGQTCSVNSDFYGCKFSTDYTMTTSEYEEKMDELSAVADEIISDLTDVDNQYQTELEIHDYIVSNCSYKLDDDLIYSSAYGCLVTGNAACEGYSKAIKYLLDEVGIENFVTGGNAVSPDTNSSDLHMWNIVNINGEYYHLDATWDDPVTNDNNNLTLHCYFNVTDELISNTHSDFAGMPECTSDEENYYVKSGLYFPDYSYTDNGEIKSIIRESRNNRESCIQLNFGNEDSYNKFGTQMIESGKIVDLIYSATGNNSSIRIDSLSYYESPETYTIVLMME